MSTTFLGMRGTGDWETNERPENWRQGIFREFPNGRLKLTGIMSMMGKEKTDDPTFHWWTKTLPVQGGDVTNVYIDVGLATPYVYATHQAVHGISGGTVYVKVAEAVADFFRVRHTAILRDTSRPRVDVVGRVTAVVKNGASSYLAVKLIEADDNDPTAATYNIATVDRILVMGSMQPEGADMPDALTQNPVEFSNYTEIFEESIDLTRTALRTKLRTEDAYKEAKRDALEQSLLLMEKSAIWGVPFSGVGDNGKPMRASQGWMNFIKTNASSNVFDYENDADYSGDTWIQEGKTWFDSKLEEIFRYGDDTKLGIIGSGALLGINQLAESYGQINIVPTTEAFGIKVLKWITPFGEVNLMTHPLFSYEVTNRYTMLLIEPRHSKFRYIDDTFFKADSEKEGGANSKDGKNESWLTEGGYEFHYPNRHGIFYGIGQDNAV